MLRIKQCDILKFYLRIDIPHKFLLLIFISENYPLPPKHVIAQFLVGEEGHRTWAVSILILNKLMATADKG
jgi:hypothetical protein